MQPLWDIAPPGTWALLALASICLLVAFILLSHSIVRRKAYDDEWGGWLSRGRLEATVRLGAALLLAGALLWAITLDAPQALLWTLGAGTLLFGGLQGAAMLRGKS